MVLQSVLIQLAGRIGLRGMATLQNAARAGLSARAAHRLLEKEGVMVHRTRVLGPVYKQLRQAQDYAEVVRNIGKGKIPNVLRIPTAVTDQGRNASWKVRIDYIDKSGKHGKRWVTVSTNDTRKTIGDIEDDALSWYDSENYEGETPVSATITGGSRRDTDRFYPEFD